MITNEKDKHDLALYIQYVTSNKNHSYRPVKKSVKYKNNPNPLLYRCYLCTVTPLNFATLEQHFITKHPIYYRGLVSQNKAIDPIKYRDFEKKMFNYD